MLATTRFPDDHIVGDCVLTGLDADTGALAAVPALRLPEVDALDSWRERGAPDDRTAWAAERLEFCAR